MKIYRTEAGAQAVEDAYRQILAGWAQPHEQLELETRHGRTFVVACGDPSAPPLLLFHGSGSNAVSWFGDMPLLAQTHRVYAVDMIGEPGLSEPNRLEWSDAGYVEWLDDVFAGLGIEQAAVAGMSLGGWLALTYACERPERIRQIVLVAPGGLAPARMSFLFKYLLFSLMGKAGSARIEKLIGWDAVSAQDEKDPLEAENSEKMMAFIQLINANFIFHRGALPQLSVAQLKALSMPVKMFFGDADALLNQPASCERLRAGVPHADIQVLPGVGHVVLGRTREIAAFLS